VIIDYLVGGFNHLEKYKSQLGLLQSKYMEEYSKCSKPPTSYISCNPLFIDVDESGSTELFRS
jgi:hypothetical protein